MKADTDNLEDNAWCVLSADAHWSQVWELRLQQAGSASSKLSTDASNAAENIASSKGGTRC